MHYYSAIILLFFLLFSFKSGFSSEIFVFKDYKGQRLFTDKKNMGSTYKFIRIYGRPPAYYQCKQVNKKKKQLQPIFIHYSQQIGFDSKLAMAVAYSESCFDNKAVSKVGAKGLMQLMPSTAKLLGVNEPFDVKQNIKGGITYLKQLFNQFDGSIKLMLAAYNAGPNNVRKYQGIPPFKETQQYVAKVITKYRQYLKEK